MKCGRCRGSGNDISIEWDADRRGTFVRTAQCPRCKGAGYEPARWDGEHGAPPLRFTQADRDAFDARKALPIAAVVFEHLGRCSPEWLAEWFKRERLRDKAGRWAPSPP